MLQNGKAVPVPPVVLLFHNFILNDERRSECIRLSRVKCFGNYDLLVEHYPNVLFCGTHTDLQWTTQQIRFVSG